MTSKSIASLFGEKKWTAIYLKTILIRVWNIKTDDENRHTTVGSLMIDNSCSTVGGTDSFQSGPLFQIYY